MSKGDTRTVAAAVLLVCSAVGIGRLPAQATVWPAPYASKPGEGAQATPFSISSDSTLTEVRSRSVTCCAAATLPFGVNQVLRGIAWRRDAWFQEQYAGYRGRVFVRLGTIPSAATPTGSFGLLLRGDVTVVFDGDLDVPAAGPPSSGPAPFALRIPFQTTWRYPGGDLAIDVGVEASPGRLWRRDAMQLPEAPPAETIQLGAGCGGSNDYEAYPWADQEHCFPGGYLACWLEGAPLPPKGVAAVCLLGDPIPPLSLQAIGFAAGCDLHVLPFALYALPLGDLSTLYSRGLFVMAIPPNPSLTGSDIALQWCILDLGLATRTPASLSNGIAIRIGSVPAPGPFYGRTIWKYGALSAWSADGGQVSPRNYVAITEFML